MSVQDIIFAASGGTSSPTSTIEYTVGVYDLPITAGWSALVYTGDKTVIVGDNTFVTITDPADQSTMKYGTISGGHVVSPYAKLVFAYGYVMTVDQYQYRVIYSSGEFSSFAASNPMWDSRGFSYQLYDIAENGVGLINPERNTLAYRQYALMKGPTYSKTGSRWAGSEESLFVPGGLRNYGNKKQLKDGKVLPSTASCHAYNPINQTYMAIGKDGFIYESTDGTNYVKNTATVIPAGSYLDMTFAGGKFCAPIYNTNKFVVIG